MKPVPFISRVIFSSNPFALHAICSACTLSRVFATPKAFCLHAINHVPPISRVIISSNPFTLHAICSACTLPRVFVTPGVFRLHAKLQHPPRYACNCQLLPTYLTRDLQCKFLTACLGHSQSFLFTREKSSHPDSACIPRHQLPHIHAIDSFREYPRVLNLA